MRSCRGFIPRFGGRIRGSKRDGMGVLICVCEGCMILYNGAGVHGMACCGYGIGTAL